MATIPDILQPFRNYYGLDEADVWGMPWNA